MNNRTSWPLSFVPLFVLAISCGGGGSSSGVTVAPAEEADLAASGPFAVGIADYTFVDQSRLTPANGTYPGTDTRTLATRVWYPADPSAVASTAQAVPGVAVSGEGPFPLIGYAHGFLSSRGEGASLKAHLASHGYVVVAPDFPLSNGAAPGGPTAADIDQQPADLAFVMQAVAELEGGSAPLARAVDRDRMGIAGLSLGGGTVLVAAYHPVFHLPGIRSAVAFAPASCFFGRDLYARAVPTLLLGGDADELVPFTSSLERAFSYAPPPVTLMRERGGTHVGFLGIDVPGDQNSDLVIGCPAVLSTDVMESDQQALLTERLTAGLSGEIIADGCTESFCENGFAQTMSAERQLHLSTIATLAHFEATLRDRSDAARYLREVLGRDNADVEVTVKR
jgi:predicted dienelactone hydrolase